MIEFDLRTYLLTDAQLKVLLGWSASVAKIYPSQAPAKIASPYLTIDWAVGDPSDEILDEDRITITIVDTNRVNASAIRDRLKILLDKQDGVQQTTFDSASVDHYVYYSKFTGGTENVDAETEEIVLTMTFNVKIKNKNP